MKGSLINNASVSAIMKGSLDELSLLKCSAFSRYHFLIVYLPQPNPLTYLEAISRNRNLEAVDPIDFGCLILEELRL
uniref:F-box/LRR-repeat protein 15-like leucin rich repeat domain-containing protein n=1 Tax=Leersia perrieri TaxID=77586 RepID=A0A0D9WQF9_9ORYZ